jgi:hypothetical protein
MQFCQISQCTKNLEFTKYRKWPSPLPAIAWKKHLLCGFERFDGQVIDMDCDLSELLKSIYVELSLTELAQLSALKPGLISQEDFDSILKAYALKSNSDLQSILQILPQTPPEFQDFVHHKKIGPRELSPLRAVPILADIAELLISIAVSPLSKSQAVVILEMTIDLYLMGRPLSDLIKGDDERAEAWLERISGHRLPLTKKTDQEFTLKTSAFSWPSHVKAEWVRKGDQSGLQISLFATSQLDFRKKLLGINKINDELTLAPEKLWTKS